MCGITGAVSASVVERDLVARMRDRLAHRGPNDSGLWVGADGRVVLGHRRLAIVDLSTEANQPFLSADGRFALTLNGEIYNFRDLRRELQAEGVRFRTRSDTEVLVEAYGRWGEGCLERLSGMFAFAVWDAERSRLFCARDRAGEKPFYYAVVRDGFFFASELKSLLLCPGFRRELDPFALAGFLTLGYVAGPRTIWAGARKLPPGHALAVELGEGELRAGEPEPYWDLELAPDEGIDDWGPPIRQALRDAADEMSFADVGVGTFLSGGMDSSSVTAALASSGREVSAFTIGFDEPGYDERPFAREVAALYGVSHVERTLRPADVERIFRDVVLWHYDEPFADYSYLPTYLVCREARGSITVALTGDGGDELFAGYRKYALLARRHAVERRLTPSVSRFVAAGGSRLLPHHGARRRLVRYRETAEELLRATLETGVSAPVLEAVARGPLAAALREGDPFDPVQAHLDRAPPAEVGLVNAMRYLDLKLTLGAGILTKVDRSSMAVSLEARPVYCNRRLLELAGRIPPGRLASGARPKRILREALRPWLPGSILDRPKQGFAAPLERWLGGDLRVLAQSTGRSGVLDEFLDRGYVDAVVAGHRGTGSRTAELHNLMFLEQWLQKWAT